MFKFADRFLPDYIKVNNITYSILPSIEAKTQSILGRGGVYDFGTELGYREIKADIQIIADNERDIIVKARDFSTWLYYEDLQPLIILDEPDKQYMARLNGDSEINELVRVGSGTLTFLCPSPYAESINEKIVTADYADAMPVKVTNNGSAKTQPVITLNVKQDSSSLAVIAKDKFVQLGKEESEEVSPITSYNKVVFYDQFTSVGTDWTSGSYVDKGIVAGDFNVGTDGTVWVVDQNNYGTHDRWHGPAKVKALTSPLQDFYLWANVKLSTTNMKQMGRVEIYLMDNNNVVIGKLSLIDGTTHNDHLRFEARAGSFSNGTTFVKTYGNKKGDFTGHNVARVVISRTGNKWFAYMAVMDAFNKPHKKAFKVTWYDVDNLYTQQLASVQIHIGAYGAYAPITNSFIGHMEIDNRNQVYNQETETPIIFKAGDEVVIDNQRAIVLHNGQPAYHLLDTSSDFFSLDRGDNGITVSPAVADLNISYKEKWL